MKRAVPRSKSTLPLPVSLTHQHFSHVHRYQNLYRKIQKVITKQKRKGHKMKSPLRLYKLKYSPRPQRPRPKG